jgi:hypothetical protein
MKTQLLFPHLSALCTKSRYKIIQDENHLGTVLSYYIVVLKFRKNVFEYNLSRRYKRVIKLRKASWPRQSQTVRRHVALLLVSLGRK